MGVLQIRVPFSVLLWQGAAFFGILAKGTFSENYP